MAVLENDIEVRKINFDSSLTTNDVMYGFLEVPMNYADPESPLISIAISRREASNQKAALGTIVLVDGGPGGDGGLGVSLPERMAELSVLRERFHLVGVDLRGRGASTLLTTAAVENPLPITSRPDTSAFGHLAEEMKRREELCVQFGGAFREHVTTRNSARDIESIRLALGVEKISFIGWAYGAYVAGVYGSMFGEHLHRVVFDSPPHPQLSWQERFEVQVDTIQRNVADWAAWATDTGIIPEWKDARAVTEGLRNLESCLSTHDVTGSLVTAYDLQVGTLASEERSWRKLLNLISGLTEQCEAGNMDSVSQSLTNNSQWRPSDVEGRLSEAVLEAVTTETPWTTDVEPYFARMERAIENAPYGFGVMRVQPWVGTFRANSPLEQVQPITGETYGRGLVVHSQRDALAPPENGNAMAQATGSSLIEVLGSGIHGIFGFHDIPELASTVLLYLQTGVAPDGIEIDLRVEHQQVRAA